LKTEAWNNIVQRDFEPVYRSKFSMTPLFEVTGPFGGDEWTRSKLGLENWHWMEKV